MGGWGANKGHPPRGFLLDLMYQATSQGHNEFEEESVRFFGESLHHFGEAKWDGSADSLLCCD